MKFEKLNEMIPYVTGGKAKILSMQPYNGITLRLPGRHAKDTIPEGGDFVVCVDSDSLDWVAHQFTHTDLFMDLEKKALAWPQLADNLMDRYYAVINGASPERCDIEHVALWKDTLHPQTFLYAVQALAVAEHRRYARFENKFGGRFLPFRFGAGIVEGLWSSADAAERQRRGRPGVEWLEREFGTPQLSKELMNA